jgi:hypothetical protein
MVEALNAQSAFQDAEAVFEIMVHDLLPTLKLFLFSCRSFERYDNRTYIFNDIHLRIFL